MSIVGEFSFFLILVLKSVPFPCFLSIANYFYSYFSFLIFQLLETVLLRPQQSLLWLSYYPGPVEPEQLETEELGPEQLEPEQEQKQEEWDPVPEVSLAHHLNK